MYYTYSRSCHSSPFLFFVYVCCHGKDSTINEGLPLMKQKAEAEIISFLDPFVSVSVAGNVLEELLSGDETVSI